MDFLLRMLMRKTIYLIRHGQIYRDGNFDTLNEEGLQFASDLYRVV